MVPPEGFGISGLTSSRGTLQDCLIYPTSYVPNKEMEYDIPYPIYIPYIGPYNVPLGVMCQGRVVTCFTPPLKTTATGRKYMPKRNVAVTNSSKRQVSRIPSHRESNLRRQSRSRPHGSRSSSDRWESNHRQNPEIYQRDPADPATSSRRNRELLCAESGLRVSHKACGVQQVKAGSFSKN